MMRGPMGKWTAVIVLLAACRAVTTSYSYPGDLSHPNYVKRTKALRHFAESNDRTHLGEAFPLLLDEESHIRMVAYRAIKGMMPGGRDFGYHPTLEVHDRIRLAQEWEAWWRTTRTSEGADG